MKGQLKYKRHDGSVETSLEDNCLFGRLLSVDALVSYEGQNEQELELAFRQAVDCFLGEGDELALLPQPPIPQHR